MTFTVEQKSLLAKLMATENIRVEHQKINTAKFDPQNRVMYLPIWEDMKGDLYDLLTGHECGHALYTPAEGWHDAVTEQSKGKNYKSFLNVVEDARIEKKMQRKYPGLRKSFRQAYDGLMQRNFFGLDGRNVNTLPFIDKLNLFTKSQYSMSMNFTEYEETLVEKVKNLESWEDVIRVTDEIYAYSKQEQQELLNEEEVEIDTYGYESGDDDYDDDDFDYEESEDDDYDSEEYDNSDDSEDAKDAKDGNSSNQDSLSSNNGQKDSKPYYGDKEPVCETDQKFRENEFSLLDKSCKEYVYLSFPKPNMKNIITPAKRVHELMSEHFQIRGYDEEAKILVDEFKRRNDRYISLLVKEFEMRKAAKAYDKRRISDTGDIDINKLSSYKFDDNIFRKMMNVPKGKSHGLVLLLDYSGSMDDNMGGSIEQILVLSMFCRKVNIPFVVYSFGNAINANMIDKNIDPDEYRAPQMFSCELNEFRLEQVFLREYLNSDMSNAEFSNALKNMILLKESYAKRTISRPMSEQLSHTPLIEAIISTGYIMNDFRKKHNLDITNLVIVHDGDADAVRFYRAGEQKVNAIHPASQNIYVRDRKIGFEYEVKVMDRFSERNEVLNAALEWFKCFTNSNIFGFFLVTKYRIPTVVREKYYYQDGSMVTTGGYNVDREKQEKLTAIIRKEKFITSYNKGYKSFYFILGGEELKIAADELEVNGKVTTNKLKNAFMKMNRQKQINRVLVSKFIQGIAV
jgi:hypothetical protein